MKISDVQTSIFEQTGLKTSFKRMKGSMKHHIKIWPIFQGGQYPKFHFDWVNEFKKQFKADLAHDCFPYGSIYELNIPASNFTEFDPIQYKKEAKPKPIDENKVIKGWGSKNSQMRLDKAAARNSIKMKKGNTARYY